MCSSSTSSDDGKIKAVALLAIIVLSCLIYFMFQFCVVCTALNVIHGNNANLCTNEPLNSFQLVEIKNNKDRKYREFQILCSFYTAIIQSEYTNHEQ